MGSGRAYSYAEDRKTPFAIIQARNTLIFLIRSLILCSSLSFSRSPSKTAEKRAGGTAVCRSPVSLSEAYSAALVFIHSSLTKSTTLSSCSSVIWVYPLSSPATTVRPASPEIRITLRNGGCHCASSLYRSIYWRAECSQDTSFSISRFTIAFQLSFFSRYTFRQRSTASSRRSAL